jgi:hypothetical protein
MLFAPLSNRDSVDFFVVGAGDESRHAIFSHQVTFLAQRVLLGRERSAHAFPIRLWINERTLAGSAADDDEDPVTITQPQAVWRAPKGNIELVPKKKVLDFELPPRLEQGTSWRPTSLVGGWQASRRIML